MRDIKKLTNVVFNENTLGIALSIAAIAGMIVGMLGIDSKYPLNSIGSGFLFGDNVAERLSRSFTEVFTSSLSSYFLMMLLIFLLGLSLWGFAVIPLVVAYKGYGIGFFSGYLTLAYGMKGFAIYALVILLGACISTLAIVISAVQAMRMSFNVFKLASPQSNVNKRLFSSIKRFTLRMSVLMIVLCVCALLDGLMNLLFSKMM